MRMDDVELGTTDSVAHTLKVLEHIEENPDITQADLAARVGIAIGTANWYLKRLVAKGHVKVKQLQRRRLRYIITPQGIAERSRLAMSYLEVSMRVYRETRSEAQRLLAQVRSAGYEIVHLDGNGDLIDICRLTCLEQGLRVRDATDGESLPRLRVDGTALSLVWPDSQQRTLAETDS